MENQSAIEKLITVRDNLKKELDALEQHEKSDKKTIMQLMHEYNDIKDATQIIIGNIAEIEQTTVTDIHRLLNLPLD